jgi:hypothetical protein
MREPAGVARAALGAATTLVDTELDRAGPTAVAPR